MPLEFLDLLGLKNDLSNMHKGHGLAAVHEGFTDFWEAIGGEQPFDILRARFIVAIHAINNPRLIEALLVSYALLPGYEKIGDITERRKRYSIQIGKSVSTIEKREQQGIALLADKMKAVDYSVIPTPEILMQSAKLLAQYTSEVNGTNTIQKTFGYIITRGSDITCSEFYIERREFDVICRLIGSGKNRILINGIGGNGKTEICHQIYNRLKGKFPWIEHVGYFTYNTSMDETLYGSLDFKKSNDRPEDIKEAWRSLESLCEKETIIFVDNLPEDAPQTDAGFQKLYNLNCVVVITSREEEISRFKAIKVGFMDTAQCKKLFCTIYDQEIEESESADLDYIINQVAFRHVLTIRILAYACRQNGYSLHRLRKELKRIGFNLRFVNVDDARSKKMVIKKYEQLFSLFRLSKGEQNILEAFSLFAYMPLDTALFEKLLLRDAKKEDPNGEYDRLTFSDISDKGWLERAGNGFALHPLIAEMVYERHVKLRKNYKAHSELIIASTDGIDFDNVEMFEEDMPSLTFADSICEKLYKYLDEPLYYMTFLLAQKYLIDFMYSDSLRWYTRLSEVDEKALDVGYLMADVYYGMSIIYCHELKFKKALDYCGLALEKRKKMKEANSSDRGLDVIYCQMARVFYKKAEYEKALEYYSFALEIRKKTLGDNHPDTILIYQHIAHVYIDKEEYDKAIVYSNLALEAAKSAASDNDYYIVSCYNVLAFAYQQKGELDKALAVYPLALEKAGNALNRPNNIALAVADTYKNMPGIFCEKREYDQALKYYESVLEIQERVQSEYHPDTLRIYDSIAIVYGKLGEHEKALECCNSNLKRRQKALREDHPQITETYNAIADIYFQKCEYRNALEYYELSLGILEKTLGGKHPGTVYTYKSIAQTYLSIGDYDNAAEYYAKAMGGDLTNIADIFLSMANDCHKKDEDDKALEFFLLTIAAKKKTLGENHPDIAGIYNNIAIICLGKGDCDRAFKYQTLALEIRENALGAGHIETANSYHNMANIYFEKKIRQSLAVLLKVL